MKVLKLVYCFLIFSFILSLVAEASEIDELRKEIKQMRQDYENKIQSLQSQLNSIQKEQKQKVAQLEQKQEEIEESDLDIDYVGRYEGSFKKGGLVVKNPFGYGNVSVGGYADMEFENFQNTNSSFDQHRFILNIGAELADRLRFYSEYEIEHGGPDSANGDGEAKVEQAWIDYLINRAVNFRTGVVLVPFGRYNIYHDSDMQDLTDRPLVARDIIPTTWAEAGAGFYGEFNPKFGEYKDMVLGYETYVINGLDDGFSDTGLRSSRGSLKVDNNNNKAWAGRFTISPFIVHELGLSAYLGSYNNNGDDITGGGIDWLSSFGQLELIGEFAHFKTDEPSGSNVTDSLTGYRLQANYHFWPSFLDETFLGRNFDNPTFTLVGRYGGAEIDDDGDAGTGNNEENRFTIGLNYRPVESWVFKTEYQFNKTDNESLERGNNDGFIASVAMGF